MKKARIRYDKDGKFKSATIEIDGFPFDTPGVRIITVAELRSREVAALAKEDVGVSEKCISPEENPNGD